MARDQFTAPRLEVEVTPEHWATAIEASSGGCLYADALKAKYPNLTGVTVDMATIRATDRKRAVRLTWLTPASAQELLLSFDQGWAQPEQRRIRTDRAVKVVPLTLSKGRTEQRAARRAELEAKAAAGELTRYEKQALTKLQRNVEPLPTSTGPAEVVERRGRTTVHGGRNDVQAPAKANPNLLRGRDRHFGAKRARPALAFERAVAEEAARLVALQQQGDS